MRLHIRIESENSQHAHLTVFIDGENCGSLCVSRLDVTKLINTFAGSERPEVFEISSWAATQPYTEIQ